MKDKKPIEGQIQPSNRSPVSQDLVRHRAMVAFELEVMAKKMDRFGWDRDRHTAAHERIILDFMDALQDYPLDRIKEACRAWVRENPRKMPNEGDILAILNPKPQPETYARRILREYGGQK